MGRTTFDEIGLLPGREWYVVSSRPVEGATAITIDEAKEMRDALVIGGQSIYRQLLPHADMVMLSVVKGVYPADTWFPSLEGWSLDWEEDHGDFKIFEYVNNRSCR